MSKRIFVLLRESITLEGQEIEAGEVVELSETSARALITEEKAAEATPDEETAAALKQLDGQDPEGQDQAAEVEKIRKALDDQYKADELKKAAKDAGVEFPYDVKKPDLIAAIIDQGKAEALLK
ncbi:hypothetical protein ACF5W4_11135 [Bacillota bacterium Lsc_1132]